MSVVAPEDAQTVARVLDLLVQHAQGGLSVLHQLCARLQYSLAWCDRGRPTLSAILQTARGITPASIPAFMRMLNGVMDCDTWEAAKEAAAGAPVDLMAGLPPIDAMEEPTQGLVAGLPSIDAMEELSQDLLPEVPSIELMDGLPVDLTSGLPPVDLMERATDMTFLMSPPKKRKAEAGDDDNLVCQRQVRAALERHTQASMVISQVTTFA